MLLNAVSSPFPRPPPPRIEMHLAELAMAGRRSLPPSVQSRDAAAALVELLGELRSLVPHARLAFEDP